MSKICFSNPSTVRAFSDHGYEYAEFSQLMKDTALNKLDGSVTKAEANDKIREVMFSALCISPDSNRKEIRKAIRRHRIDLFEIIEETVDDLLTSGWEDNEFFERFVEVRNLALGDTNEFYTKEQLILNVSKVSGNHHDIIRQRLNQGTAYHIPVNTYAVKVFSDMELFLAGRIDWADMITHVYAALDNYVTDMVYESFMSLDESVTPADQFVKTGTLSDDTKDEFIELITDVQAANRGSQIVIVGTKAALSKLYAISDVDWIAETSKEERRTLGRLGIWEGTEILEIPQVFAANTTTKVIDDTKLLILPNVDWRPIKLIYEGDAEITEITDSADNQDMSMSYEYLTKIGVGTIVNRKFGSWTIAS